MNIGIPVAQFHPGNTSEYVIRACETLGHTATLLNKAEFVQSLRADKFDFFLCVDSGEVFDFRHPDFATLSLKKVSYWFIDYRHHWDGVTRKPGDLEVAQQLDSRGGTVYQSQFEDVEHCRANGIKNVHWLPLAADPSVWCPEPIEQKFFDVGFVGNVWDRGRADALQILLNQRELKVGFFGHGALWKEDGAQLLRRSKVGFNISSYFGNPHAFDVNMRVFETLSCGTPLFTNSVPGLEQIFSKSPQFIRTFNSLTDLVPLLHQALSDEAFITSGKIASEWIAQNATYEYRVAGVIGNFRN